MEERYSRQIIFKEIGEEGQLKIKNSRVVVIGCGALGSIISNNLVRAGVGKIKIVDRDLVDITNLQRQVLFDEDDVNKKLPKAIAAKNKLEKINSEVEIEAVVGDVNSKNIEEIIKDAGIVLDGTDNFETRFLINDACIKRGIPWIYGAVIGSAGSTMVIIPEKTPCLRCVVEEIPIPGNLPTCETLGVINTIPLIIASFQTTEALKIITGSEKINRDLILIDLWGNTFERIKIERKKDCQSCVKRNFKALDEEETSFVSSLCGRNAVQIVPKKEAHLNFKDLEKKLSKFGKVRFNEFLLSFEIQEYEFIIFPNARAIIKGTRDISVAKSLYSQYMGT